MKAPRLPYQCSGQEVPKPERVVVQYAARLRIFGKQNLKASVQAEAVYDIGPNSATGRIRRLKQAHPKPGLRQFARTSQTSQSSANDHSIEFHLRLEGSLTHR